MTPKLDKKGPGMDQSCQTCFLGIGRSDFLIFFIVLVGPLGARSDFSGFSRKLFITF